MTDLATLTTTSPIIVCGNPRSGTRMHANVLNAHPDVVITDEFHDIALLWQILSNFRKKKLLKKLTRERSLYRQVLLAKSFWLSYSIDRIAERGFTARIVGNKTPLVEKHFEILERIFYNAPPKYVYCLRSASKVLRSVKNLPTLSWNRHSVETNLARYIESVRHMEQMRSLFPDRVLVSVIEHLPPGQQNSVFFERMFAFVGVTMDAAVREAVDAIEAQNTMEAVKKARRQESATLELTDEELELISMSPDYADIRQTYDLERA